MDESFVAVSIDICGSAIRYAAVARPDEDDANEPRLVQAGCVELPFDASHALLHADASASPDALHDTLRSALETPTADVFSIVTHPNDTFAFFTPLSVESSVAQRKRELRQRAALLTQIRDIDRVTLHAKTVRTADLPGRDDRLMWVHVLAVPDDVENRIRALADHLGFPAPEWHVSTEATVPVMGRIELRSISHENALRPYSLAVGAYPTHTEYALSYDRNWHHSHMVIDAETTDDRAYYAVSMLNRLRIPVQSIGRVFLYGTAVQDQLGVFESVFDRSPTPLSLQTVLDTSACDAIGDDAEAVSAFAPCVGAGLLA